MKNPKTIAVVTTGRQDWGILRSTVKQLHEADEFTVAIIAGGMACADAFGNIADRIENEGLPVYRRLSWTVDSMKASTCQQIAEAVVMAEDCFKELNPDAVLLLGDRFETLAIAQVATLMKITLIHLHGGEETKGAIDNQMRHAITKLSHIHFVSHPDHAKRVIQMGENPENVHVVGAPGLDNINRDDLPDMVEILNDLNLKRENDEPIFLITYHPPTLLGDSKLEVEALLTALAEFDAVCIFTMPNNDPGNQPIQDAIAAFGESLPQKRSLVKALGEQRYWGGLRQADVVIGNSSSGIIEAPAVPVPVVNIGQRQAGRAMAPCIIDLPFPDAGKIKAAIETCLSPVFKKTISSSDSLYGDGHSAEKIYQKLRNTDFDELKIKTFFDEVCSKRVSE